MKKIVVTVIGADSVGIVAGVTKELALQNIIYWIFLRRFWMEFLI